MRAEHCIQEGPWLCDGPKEVPCCGAQMVSRTRMADAAPLGAVRAEEDGFMCWFEAWASALRRGYYQVQHPHVQPVLIPCLELLYHVCPQQTYLQLWLALGVKIFDAAG